MKALTGFLIVCLLGYWALPTLSEQAPQDRQASIAKAKGMVAVRAVLVDPSSARFDQVRVTSHFVVCGLVNGRNRFGGYAGRRRFVVLRSGLTTIDDGSAAFNRLWQNWCENKLFIG